MELILSRDSAIHYKGEKLEKKMNNSVKSCCYQVLSMLLDFLVDKNMRVWTVCRSHVKLVSAELLAIIFLQARYISYKSSACASKLL